MVQLDNIKMWESLIEGNSVTYESGRVERGDLAMRIIHALKDQGLDYQDGKIVETKQQSVDEAMADIEEKSKLFTEAHQGENTDDILRQMQGEESIEWSEEDERIRSCLIYQQEEELEKVENDKYGHSEIISDLKEMYRERIDWLKSLRPQNRWKPSDLPRWKKSTLPNDNTTGFNSDYFCHKGYCINYKELFEKLPKDE